MEKFYLTTPLYYVNASPHIGHAYTQICADCIARYMRSFLGEDKVWFLTGTDEHGQKIQRVAEENGLSSQEFCDRMVLKFINLWKKLNISYNDFIRTTEARHINFVRRVLQILYEKGEIYEDIYEGWYCTPCESFWSSSQVEDKICPDCHRPVERLKEKNFFFRLSKYQEWLIDYIQTHPEFIKPDFRLNEVLSFLRNNKLNDLCISRPKERLSWGIELPFSQEHVCYVWFDALLNYISAVGEFDSYGNYYSKWWPADLHLIGKDILRQHAIYWPIILQSLGIKPPRAIFAHGWWLVGKDKMSKSRGNIVDPEVIIERFGVDVLRYFLLRDVPFGLDGNFSEESIIKRLNSDLANDLGNLVYRVLSMIEKYFEGKIPSGDLSLLNAPLENKILERLNLLDQEIALSLREDLNFSSALEKIWELVNLANKYIEEKKPWNLFRENKLNELKAFIFLLIKVIKVVKEKIYPFMPDTAMAIGEQIKDNTVKKSAPLFLRIKE